ncbi:MAG TPA: hypothetical protein VGU68_10170, partial [Ktedonobacteraceae bacterium]|nr:hypothetical protein [Ktedonobacteraceae bacterium]
GVSTVRVRRRQERPVTVSSGAQNVSVWSRLLPPQVMAIAIKDVKYYRRDPQLLGLLFQSVFSIVVLLVVTLLNTGGSSRLTFLGSWTVLLAPFYVFLALYTLSYNVLGIERQSLTTLLLFPVDPKRILWGKNLVVFCIGVVEEILIILLAAFLTGAWGFIFPALAIGLAGIGVILGIGNFTSVFFPMRMRQIQRGFQSSGANASTQNGCLRAVMSMVTLGIMVVVLIPVGLALVLPVFLHERWIWFASIPASLIYGAAIYFVVTALVAPRIVERMPEILAATTRE